MGGGVEDLVCCHIVSQDFHGLCCLCESHLAAGLSKDQAQEAAPCPYLQAPKLRVWPMAWAVAR